MIVQRHDAPRGFTAADNIFTGTNTFTSNVGIGTSNPQELLHVGAGTDSSDITATDLLVTRAGPSNLSVRDSTNGVEIFLFASSVGGVMGTVTNDPLNILTNNISAIFIDASQNVDIPAALTAASYGGIVETNLPDKAAAEAITGDWTFDGNHPVEGYTTGRNVIRNVVISIVPGGTPGTNINVTDLSEIRGFNSPTITPATNLANGGSSGSFNITSNSLRFDPGESFAGVLAGYVNYMDTVSDKHYSIDFLTTSDTMNLALWEHGTGSNTGILSAVSTGATLQIHIMYMSTT